VTAMAGLIVFAKIIYCSEKKLLLHLLQELSPILVFIVLFE